MRKKAGEAGNYTAVFESYINELVKDSYHWKDLYENGGTDPNYCDGANLNLVRNHIIYGKRKIEEFVSEHPEFSIPQTVNDISVPDKVPNEYMANPEKIIKEAKENLSAYEQDENLQYLLSIKDDLTDKEADSTSIFAVIGYYKRLRSAISKNDLLTMRLHSKGSTYQDSFRQCAEKVKKCISERTEDEKDRHGFVQLSLF